jgi:hypothetical protein
MTVEDRGGGPKQLELLREVLPNATVIAVLINPTNPAIRLLGTALVDDDVMYLDLQRLALPASPAA